MRPLDAFDRLPVGLKLLTCFALEIGVAFADFRTGALISLSVFFLVPISLATWTVSAHAGFVLSVLAACSYWALDARDAVHDSWALQNWAAIAQLAFFLVVTLLLARLRAARPVRE